MKARPPRIAILFIGLVLIFTLINLLRLALAWQTWEVFAGRMSVSPAFLALSGLVWSLVGLCLATALWFGLRLAPLAASLTLVAYSLYFWVTRLAPPGHTGRNSNGLFLLGANLFVLAWSLWVFTRPKVRMFYGQVDSIGEEHEQRSEN